MSIALLCVNYVVLFMPYSTDGLLRAVFAGVMKKHWNNRRLLMMARESERITILSSDHTNEGENPLVDPLDDHLNIVSGSTGKAH